MNDTAFLVCPDLKERKKKDQPSDPPDFQAKRANKPFFRPYLQRLLIHKLREYIFD